MRHAVIALLLCGTVLVLSGCKDRESPTPPPKAGEVQSEMEEAVDAAADYAYTQKEQFLSSMSTQLDNLDKQIAELKVKAEKQGAELKDETKVLLADLEKRVAEAKKKAKDAQGKSEEAWEAAKKDLNEAVNDLKKAYAEAAEELD